MAEAEHPSVAPGGAYGATDLIGEGLKGKGVIAGGERAAQGIVGALGGLLGEQDTDGFLEPTIPQVLESAVGDSA